MVLKICLLIVSAALFCSGIVMMNYGQKFHPKMNVKVTSLISKLGIIFVFSAMAMTCFTFSSHIDTKVILEKVSSGIEQNHPIKAEKWFYVMGLILSFGAFVYILEALWILFSKRKID